MLSRCVVDHFTRNQDCGLGADKEISMRAIETMSMRFAFMFQTRLRSIAHMKIHWPCNKMKGVDILGKKEDTGKTKPKAIVERKAKRKKGNRTNKTEGGVHDGQRKDPPERANLMRTLNPTEQIIVNNAIYGIGQKDETDLRISLWTSLWTGLHTGLRTSHRKSPQLHWRI